MSSPTIPSPSAFPLSRRVPPSERIQGSPLDPGRLLVTPAPRAPWMAAMTMTWGEGMPTPAKPVDVATVAPSC